MIIKAPFNYIGNKYRIMHSLLALFPRHIDKMVDLFCGGCDVTVNVNAKKYYSNDINFFIIGILKAFQDNELETILNHIDSRINQWNLTKENKSGYLAFRDYYNKTQNPLDLYTLMCFSFNYQFRFNSDHKYNNPFGQSRSSFNPTMRENLIKFKGKIDDVNFSSMDFRDFNYAMLKPGDFVYADPPYLITTGTYNDGKRGFKGWNQNDDIDLFNILDKISRKGINFALSNVIEHKGLRNDVLYDWAMVNHYNIHNINFNYNNSNYHAKKTDKATKEVLITNY